MKKGKIKISPYLKGICVGVSLCIMTMCIRDLFEWIVDIFLTCLILNIFCDAQKSMRLCAVEFAQCAKSLK